MFGIPLWTALGALTLIAALGLRDKCMAWVGTCLLANWCANTIMVSISGTQFNWLGMAAIDYMTAVAILCLPLRRWQIAISVLYVIELVAHTAYAFTDEGPWAQYRYWWALHYFAWGQALLLGVWECGDGFKGAWNRWGYLFDVRPLSPVLARLGKDKVREKMK